MQDLSRILVHRARTEKLANKYKGSEKFLQQANA